MHTPRVWPRVDDDVYVIILHRRVKVFFHYRSEAVDLVDEKHVTLIEVGQDARDTGRLVKNRPARRLNAGTHLLSNDIGERRLAKPRRTGQQNVVKRFTALPRRGNKNPQIIFDLLLADKVIERLRA